MDFASICHKTSEQMSYPLNEDELIINIKTGYDVKKVYIYYGDPFDAGILGGSEKWSGKREEIYFKKRLKHQIWWTTTIRPEFKRCRYYFELHTDKEVWYYFEDGFLTKEQMEAEGKTQQCFIVPWMNPVDINRTPQWVNDTVWYQIFPDRFCNGDPKNSEEGVTPWRIGPVTNEERFGGNLEGMIQKLPYLKDLGINGIYLTPIFEAKSNHKYDTTDYYKIDPSFGDEKIFGRFVKEAHAMGIRVMLDGVFNHCGHYFAPWQDVLKYGPESEYFDWFMVKKWPFNQQEWDTRDGKFYSFAFASNMPKLNTNNNKVIQYISDVCAYWVESYQIDGIRFDVGNEVSHRLLKELRKRLKKIKPDLYLMGEIWHNASQWLLGDEYDSVMNYPLRGSIQDFFMDQSCSNIEFEYMVNRCYTMYMQQNNNVLFNLLDSHDTERLIYKVKDLDVFFQQLAVLFTMPGSPCIFYGTEIALNGAHDPDCRRCMPWDELDQPENRERIDNVKRLIQLRKSKKTFKSPHFHFPEEKANPRFVRYIKLYEGEEIEVLLNCSKVNWEVSLPGQILYQRKYTNGVLSPNGVVIADRK